MGKIKVSRKSLKQDELKDFGQSVIEFYDGHQVKIWVVLSAIALIFILSKVWGNSRDRVALESAQEINASISLFLTALQTEDRQQRGRIFQQVVRLCDSVRIRRPGSPVARRALLIKGNAEFYQNHHQTAIAIYTQYMESAQGPDELAQAHIALGYCHENLFFNSGMTDSAEFNEARTQYNLAADIAQSGHLKRQADFSRARMNEVTGREKDVMAAIAIYNKIIEEAEAAEEEQKKRFGDDQEEKQALSIFLPPTVSDLFNADSRARTQLDRLEALLKAGQTAALADRSLPAEGEAADGDEPEAGDSQPPASQPADPGSPDVEEISAPTTETDSGFNLFEEITIDALGQDAPIEGPSSGQPEPPTASTTVPEPEAGAPPVQAPVSQPAP